MKSVRNAIKLEKRSLQHPPTKLLKSKCMSSPSLRFQPHPCTRSFASHSLSRTRSIYILCVSYRFYSAFCSPLFFLPHKQPLALIPTPHGHTPSTLYAHRGNFPPTSRRALLSVCGRYRENKPDDVEMQQSNPENHRKRDGQRVTPLVAFISRALLPGARHHQRFRKSCCQPLH